MPGEDLPSRARPAHFPATERHNRSVIFFVTACTKNRKPVLASEAAHRALREAWQAADRYRVGRYVIMPDHMHFFCAPGSFPPESLGRWISYWKSLVARHWPSGDGKLWQRDYWDTQLRQSESYAAKWIYVRANPVRAGLCAKPEAWPFQGEIHILDWHD